MSVTRFRKRKPHPISAERSLSDSDANVRSELIGKNLLAAQPVLNALAHIGFRIGTIADLFNRKLDYRAAVPILVRWLPEVSNPSVKEDIVRALPVRWAKPTAVLPLIEEFEQADERVAPSLKRAIANALSFIADDRVFEQISLLARDRRHGRAREMLALALGNMSDQRAVDVLIDLLVDDEVAGHAIMALGKLRADSAKARIRCFESHRNAWIRREAHKAIKRIEGK